MKRFLFSPVCIYGIIIFLAFSLTSCKKTGNQEQKNIKSQDTFCSSKQNEMDTSMCQEETHDDLPALPFVYSSDSSSITVHPRGCSNSITMIMVEGGVFSMGNNDGYNTKPEHRVELSDFFIADKEVTQALWKEIMGTNGSDFAVRLQFPLKPADNISWYDALKFIGELNSLTDLQFRLPTEAEWEYAAKGGNKSCGYTYSGSDNINQVAWWAGNSYNVKPLGPDYGTHYVGTKSPNELGLYDMSGNVWEWCQDWYNDYTRKIQKNPTGPAKGCAKIVRGGCFTSGSSCKNVSRGFKLPDEHSFVGVRLALSSDCANIKEK